MQIKDAHRNDAKINYYVYPHYRLPAVTNGRHFFMPRAPGQSAMPSGRPIRKIRR
jgi:hypothetical protein